MVQSHLDRLLSQWFPHPPKKIAVAVSGGVDSMALAYGLHQWARAHGKTTVTPIIVDHGLRSNSRHEAQQVAGRLSAWGLEPVVLPWVHSTMTTGLMEKARIGRYGVLAMACHQRGIDHLCVGHHQDDMLETVWMRQQMRGPERGWSGMSAITMRYGVILLRPFLHTPKVDLEKWMRDCAVDWVDDPTNRNPSFYRTHARQWVQSWDAGARTEAWDRILAWGDRRRIHDEQLRHLTSSIHGLGYVLVQDFRALCHLPYDDGCLWVQSWVHSFGFRVMAGTASQGQLWQRLQDAFRTDSEKAGRIIATFAGCVWIRNQQQLWIFREHARISTESVCAHKHLWDDRIFSNEPIQLNRAQWNPTGSWKARWIRTSLPHEWDPQTMHYRPCNWPYPHFSTLTMPLVPLDGGLYGVGLQDERYTHDG